MKRFIFAAFLVTTPALAQTEKLVSPIVVTEAYVNAVFEVYPAEVRDGRIAFENKNGTIRMTRWAADDAVPGSKVGVDAKRPKTLAELLHDARRELLELKERVTALENK